MILKKVTGDNSVTIILTNDGVNESGRLEIPKEAEVNFNNLDEVKTPSLEDRFAQLQQDNTTLLMALADIYTLLSTNTGGTK